MANLKKFLNPNFQINQKFNLYHELARNHPIGNVTPLIVEELRIKAKGSINFGVINIENKMVEIIMPDTSPSGRCTIIFDGHKIDNVPYETRGNDLFMLPENSPPLSEFAMQRGNRDWSWFGVKLGFAWLGWFGTWPANKELTQADLDAAPQQIRQTVA